MMTPLPSDVVSAAWLGMSFGMWDAYARDTCARWQRNRRDPLLRRRLVMEVRVRRQRRDSLRTLLEPWLTREYGTNMVGQLYPREPNDATA